MTIKHFEAPKSVKNKIQKIAVKSQNDGKVPAFYMFYVITQPFLNIST